MRYAGLFLIALVGCAAQNDLLNPALAQNAELLERDVFDVVIADMTRGFKTTAQILPMTTLVSEDSLHWSLLGMYQDSLSPSGREAANDFRLRNADSSSAQVPLRLDVPYRWITTLEVREAEANPYRKVRMSEGLVVGLSHVGFSRDYRHALTYAFYVCGACAAPAISCCSNEMRQMPGTSLPSISPGSRSALLVLALLIQPPVQHADLLERGVLEAVITDVGSGLKT